MPRKKKEVENKKEIKTKINNILMTEEERKEWLKSFSDIEIAIANLYKENKKEKTNKPTKK